MGWQSYKAGGGGGGRAVFEHPQFIGIASRRGSSQTPVPFPTGMGFSERPGVRGGLSCAAQRSKKVPGGVCSTHKCILQLL